MDHPIQEFIRWAQQTPSTQPCRALESFTSTCSKSAAPPALASASRAVCWCPSLSSWGPGVVFPFCRALCFVIVLPSLPQEPSKPRKQKKNKIKQTRSLYSMVVFHRRVSLESCFRISVFIFTRREPFQHYGSQNRINPADLKLLQENCGRESNLPKSAAAQRITLKHPCSHCLHLPGGQPRPMPETIAVLWTTRSKQPGVGLEFLLSLFSFLQSRSFIASYTAGQQHGEQVQPCCSPSAKFW